MMQLKFTLQFLDKQTITILIQLFKNVKKNVNIDYNKLFDYYKVLDTV